MLIGPNTHVQHLTNHFIGVLSCAIRLRVVCTCHFQFSTNKGMQFLPEMTDKQWVLITNYEVQESMKLVNFCKDQFSHLLGSVINLVGIRCTMLKNKSITIVIELKDPSQFEESGKGPTKSIPISSPMSCSTLERGKRQPRSALLKSSSYCKSEGTIGKVLMRGSQIQKGRKDWPNISGHMPKKVSKEYLISAV